MSAVVELTRPRTPLILRWFGHGDLAVLVDQGLVLLRGTHVEALAGIPPWSTGETLIGEDWHVIGDVEYYELEDAIARCEAADTDTAAAFLGWLNDTLPAHLQDDVLDQAQRLPGFIGSYPVDVAARHLSKEPGVHLGRTTLFQHMHALGWIDRTSSGEWEIATPARRGGLLTLRAVARSWVRRDAATAPYTQIHVTPDGLAQLRASLLEQNLSPPGPPPPPTLFD